MYFFDNHEATHLWKHSFSYKGTHSAAEQMFETRGDKTDLRSQQSSVLYSF